MNFVNIKSCVASSGLYLIRMERFISEGTKDKFCSEECATPVYVCFINRSSYKARVFWIDYDGCKQLYNVIGPGQFMDVNSFVSHLWIFENELGDRLLIDRPPDELTFNLKCKAWELGPVQIPHKENFPARVVIQLFPQEEEKLRLSLRRNIFIRNPLFSLKARSLQVIRDCISSTDDISALELPPSLKENLETAMQQKICSKIHSCFPCKCLSYLT